jgi:uncharacterized protein (DUF1684 family)
MNDYLEQLVSWRKQMDENLREELGWLSLAGLFWLKNGCNTIGTGLGNLIVFPSDSGPESIGIIEVEGNEPRLKIHPGVEAKINGNPVTEYSLVTDSVGDPDVVQVGRLFFIVIEREGQFAVRLWDPECEERNLFPGRVWYEPDLRYRLEGEFIEYSRPVTLTIQNSQDRERRLETKGYVLFNLDGVKHRLEAATLEDGELYLIFRDGTSGVTTYSSGRFLYTSPPEDGSVILDFNRAHSPPCSFTQYAICPFPPPANHLSVDIEAGERHYNWK